MEVSLSPGQERWIATLIGSGRYEDADDVVHEALRLLKDWEEDPIARLDALRRAIRTSVEQLGRGEGLDGEEVFERLLAETTRAEENAACPSPEIWRSR